MSGVIYDHLIMVVAVNQYRRRLPDLHQRMERLAYEFRRKYQYQLLLKVLNWYFFSTFSFINLLEYCPETEFFCH